MKTPLVLCDTNIIISYMINDEKTIRVLQKIHFDNILISSITEMELMRGAGNKQELQLMKKNITGINVVHFNEGISQLSCNFITEFHLSQNLQIPDAIIAATAVYYQIPLLTYNTKDFKFINGLHLLKGY